MVRSRPDPHADEEVGDPDTLFIFFVRMRERRVELGLSQTELGAKIGVPHPRISEIERGVFPADPRRLVAIADALGVSLDWLFGRE